MTAPTEEQTTEGQTAEPEQQQSPVKPVKRSLEDTLAALDEADRAYVLGEVTGARTEAKGLRERLKASEPKVAEYDRLAAASRTAEERAQEAATAAEERAAAANQRAARAEVKAVLAGVVDDPDGIIEDLDLAKFVDEDGDVDTDAVRKLRDKYARFGNPRTPRPDPSQASGARQSRQEPRDEFASILRSRISGTPL